MALIQPLKRQIIGYKLTFALLFSSSEAAILDILLTRFPASNVDNNVNKKVYLTVVLYLVVCHIVM